MEKITNFPNTGGNKKITLENSKYPQFSHSFSSMVKDEFPQLWEKGGSKKTKSNFTADDAFEMWTRHKLGERSDEIIDWIKRREKYLDNHKDDHKLPGVISANKWGGILKKGKSFMKDTIYGEINKIKKDRFESTEENTTGIKKAKQLINSGSIDESNLWNFSSEDANMLLGPDKSNFSEYAECHLAIDTNESENAKGRYKYPFSKGGKIWRKGIIAAKLIAASQNQTNIVEVTDNLLNMINKKIGKKEDSVSQRYDLLELDEKYFQGEFLEEKLGKTDEGFLKGRAIVTNIGVFSYMQADGTIKRELRPPGEVFAPESLDTIKMKPMSNDHPDVMIDPENIKMLQVGNLGDSVICDSYHISVGLIVNQKDAIEDVLAGKRALSMGYTADIEETPGTYLGVQYDAIQRNIKYNHCAIVDKGRAGDAVKMRVDSNGWSFPHGKLAFSTEIQNEKSSNRGESMKKIKIDGVDYDAEAPVIAAYTQMKEKADGLEENVNSMKKDHLKVEAERDSFKEKSDTLETENKKLKENSVSKEDLDGLFEEKMKILDLAEKVEVEIKEDMTDLDVKKEIIKKVFPASSDKVDSADENYIDARFDIVDEEISNRADADKNDLNPDIRNKQSSKKNDSKTARANMLSRFKKKDFGGAK